VNIEFSHIYTNQTLGKDQIVGGKIAKQISHLLFDEGLVSTTNVWIDDYNPINKKPPILFAIKYLHDLWEHINFSPHYYAFESDVVSAGQILLETIPSSLKKLENKGRNKKKLYIKTPHSKKIGTIEQYNPLSNKYTCPLLSAAYALAKCGAPLNVYPKQNNNGNQNVPFTGEKSITILPKNPFFIESETKAKELISVSNTFSEYLDSIYHVWFDPDHPPNERELIAILKEIDLLKGE